MSAVNWVSQSGFLSNTELNLMFQRVAQPLMKFRQFVTTREAFGKRSGESVNWMKISNVGTYGGSLTETRTMHETDYTPTWGTLSVNEYGNAIPFTFKVTALSKFDVEDIVRGALLDDQVKVIDGSIEQVFNETKLRYVGTSTAAGSVTTDGTATATNTSALNAYHIRKMVTQLKKRNVPGYRTLNGDYAAIVSIEASENMATNMESVFQYTESGFKPLLNGFITRYHGVQFVEDTFGTRFTYNASARTATAKSWSGGESLDSYIFGSPTVREAVVVPPEIRAKVATDFGRSHGLAWYAILGWAIEWDTAADSRIIKWDSAA